MSRINIFIGRCIYCGGPGETDEHIIPSALGGKHILRKASCQDCRQLTSQWERNPLRDNWSEVRAVLGYPSRRRKFDEEVFPIKVILKDGTERELNLKREESFGMAHFLEYPMPGYFSGSSFDKGVLITGARLIGFGRHKETIEKYEIKEINYSINYKGTHFERMVVRIAYCAAIATWGVDSFEDCFVLPLIMGTKEDLGRYMGCDPYGRITPIIGKVYGDNIIQTGVWQKAGDDKNYGVIKLKFFAASDAPEYVVIVGVIKPDRAVNAR